MMQLSHCLRQCHLVARYSVAASLPDLCSARFEAKSSVDTSCWYTTGPVQSEKQGSTGILKFNNRMFPTVHEAETLKEAYLTIKEAVYSGSGNYSHREFQQAAAIMIESSPQHTTIKLVKCLKLLLPVFTDDTPLITMLINRLMEDSPEMPLSLAIEMVPTLHPHVLQTEARQALNKAIIARIMSSDKLKKPSLILDLMSHFVTRGQSEIMKHLAGLLSPQCGNMDGHLLLRFLSLQAQQGVRWGSHLKLIMQHLKETFAQTEYSPQQLSLLLSALVKLSLPDKELVEMICGKLQGHVGNTSVTIYPSVLIQIVSSLRHLRWSDANLLDNLSERLLADAAHLKLYHYEQLLNMAAILNRCPPAVNHHLDIIVDCLKASMGKDERVSRWLSAAWSLVVLRQASADLVSSVLTHFSKINKADLTSMVPGDIWRLRTISTAAKCDFDDHPGPFLPDILSKPVGTPSRSQMYMSVLKALSLIAPVDKYIRQHQPSPLGYILDIEIVVDLEGKLQPLVKDGDAGCHKVAVQLLNFKDMTLDTLQPLGPSLMMKRHLESVGYTVIQIPYTEFGQKKFPADRAVYIQEKIKTVMTGS